MHDELSTAVRSVVVLLQYTHAGGLPLTTMHGYPWRIFRLSSRIASMASSRSSALVRVSKTFACNVLIR